MADAICVGQQEPPRQPKAGKAPVVVAPAVDVNGVPLPADYVSTVREGLGGTGYVSEPKTVTVLTSHQATRVDF
jgi:hypothetical protein